MTYKSYISVFLILQLLVFSTVYAEDSAYKRERKIKAAFLYNFINFVQWPENTTKNEEEPLAISVLGMTGMNQDFLFLVNKEFNHKKIIVRQFDNFCDSAKKLKKAESRKEWKQDIELLKKSHVVFISDCKSLSDEDISLVLKELKGTPVLTVGETKGFLEKGGIINFLTDDNKVRFEINLKSAVVNSLKIRSRLIKLAKRIIKEEDKEPME